MSAEKKITGRIYKILNLDDDKDMYISSTIDKLSKKLWRIKKDIGSVGYPMTLFQYKMKNGDKSNFRIELIEEASFPNKTEMIRLERRYIEKLNPNLNKIVQNELDAKKCLENTSQSVKQDKIDEKQ